MIWYPEFDTKLKLVLELQFWYSEMSGIPTSSFILPNRFGFIRISSIFLSDLFEIMFKMIKSFINSLGLKFKSWSTILRITSR